MGKPLNRKIEVLLQQYIHKISYPFYSNKQQECKQETLRCEDAKNSPFYRYFRVGKNTPPCCASHLVELLLWTDKILQNHTIPYFALWGTHIGALRHKGLIPWDTDIDIGIEKQYEEKAERLLLEEAPKRGYFINRDEDNLIRIQYSQTNTLHVDIEIWNPLEENPKTVAFEDSAGYMELPLDSIYPLIDLPFYNFTIQAPHSSQYLKDFFGETIFTHGYKKYDFFCDKEFPLEDTTPASIRWELIKRDS